MQNKDMAPDRNQSDFENILRTTSDLETLRQAQQLKPGEKLEIWDRSPSIFREPRHTIVRTEEGVEIYEGSSSIFKEPKQVIKTSPADPCYIASEVYGSPDCREVQSLRNFRDQVLQKNPLGRAFVHFYYSGAGKTTANFISSHANFLKPLIKSFLDYLAGFYVSKDETQEH